MRLCHVRGGNGAVPKPCTQTKLAALSSVCNFCAEVEAVMEATFEPKSVDDSSPMEVLHASGDSLGNH